MHNLLGNSVKFTSEGTIRIRVEYVDGSGSADPDPGVRITIGDTGIGIDKEHLDSIFNEFQQVGMSYTPPPIPLRPFYY
jgi:signal transduction histidine kinase